MAEPRRVQLTTLFSDVPASDMQPPPHEPPSGAFQVGESCSEPPAETDTVRLVLTLFEPDERSFPEFSYSQLTENKVNHTSDKVSLSIFEEEEKRENDEVVAMARKLEKKYGGKPKKKDRIQDLIDIGYGYDDEDSFIDNSEAYDEFVPASITTRFGGFYVNSGVLQFRQASDTETDTEDFTAEDKTPEQSKKRKLNSGQDKPKKKRCRGNEEKKKNMDSKSSTLSEIGQTDELKKKKKKKSVGTLSVTSMLKKFQREKEKERQKTERANPKAVMIIGASTMPLCPADAAGGGGSVFTDPLLSLIGSTNDHTLIQAASTVDFDIDLDSLLDVSEETLLPKSLPQPTIVRQLVHPTDDQTQLIVSGKAQTQNTKTILQPKSQPEQMQLLPEANSLHQLVPMPEGLTPALEESIHKLTVATKTSEGESKLKFFTPEINSMLLDIELLCREQGGQVRSKVYTHLSSFLPCSRDTLFKRVKKLLVTHMVDKAEPPDVDHPMQRLKEAIGRAMPEQIACYQENYQAYEKVKLSKATEEGKEDGVVTEDNVEEKGGKRGGPKKLFKWNEEIRECLCHVLMPKMGSYTKERKGSQEIEEYLKTLLDNEVKPLWPKGWMQSRVLIRESKKLLGLFTSLPVKKARSEKKHPDNLQATPPLKGELSQETDDVFIEGSDIPLGTGRKEGAALKQAEHKKGEGIAGNPGTLASVESGKLLRNVTSTPAHSLLELLADQALAHEQPLPVPQELLRAAVAKYKHSVQRWSFGVDMKSPPPPPPSQSSPVNFPISGTCHVALPQLLQERGFGRHMDAGHVQIIPDDDDDADIIIL